MEKFDVVVIGGGPGGYPAAIRAAQLGASVALVEKEELGGTCLNWGCIPTKTLIASSDLYWRMNHTKELGLAAEVVSFDYELMAKRKDNVVSTLKGGVTQLLKANGVKVFSGEASFSDRNKIKIKPAEKKKPITIEASNTIIATGSESTIPEFLPKSKRVIESRKFLALSELPESLIVLGGGVIGCEFACMAAQLGSQVTIVELLDDILLVLDSDVRSTLRGHMEEELGITILTGKLLEDIKASKDCVSGMFGKKKIEADMLLASIGRRPVTKGLGLKKIGLETDEAGCIETDKFCRTAVATVYAVGDVTAGSTQLAHAATSQGVTAAENAYGGTRQPAETLVPACIFTAPEVGCVGITEQEAKEAGLEIRTGKYQFASLGKAMAAGETVGFVKWIVDADTDQLIGAHAVGPHATELISEAAIAIRSELTAEELGATIHCHPTFSESWMEAAHAVHGECIHQPPRRR